MVEMGGHDSQIKFLAFPEVVDGEEQADRIGPAGNRNDDRRPLERQLEPAPFGDQVADEIVHDREFSRESHELHESIVFELV